MILQTYAPTSIIMAMKDLHRLEKYMDKNTIKKLTHLSKLSIPDSDIDELVTNLEKILELNWRNRCCSH